MKTLPSRNFVTDKKKIFLVISLIRSPNLRRVLRNVIPEIFVFLTSDWFYHLKGDVLFLFETYFVSHIVGLITARIRRERSDMTITFDAIGQSLVYLGMLLSLTHSPYCMGTHLR